MVKPSSKVNSKFLSVKSLSQRAHLKRGHMQKCSYCGRGNNDGSMNCAEYGTPLVEDRIDPQRARGQKLMLGGIIWFFVGLAATLFSYSAAPYGGTPFIAAGAIVFGLAQFFRGRAAARGTDSAEQAQELLEVAAQLESVDRTTAVALYAKIVRKYTRTRASNEAQRNIQALTSLWQLKTARLDLLFT
jgi:hypothetical protein